MCTIHDKKFQQWLWDEKERRKRMEQANISALAKDSKIKYLERRVESLELKLDILQEKLETYQRLSGELPFVKDV